MRIFETLFGLEFVEVTDDSKHVWHEDTKQFRVYNEKLSDGSEQTFVGWLYLDLHPREGKYGHAANFNLQPVCFLWRVVLLGNFTNSSVGLHGQGRFEALSRNGAGL